jgi:tetratricopeptide (TPR) repeat protein
MTGRQTHLAELADCERALGRPERAIDLFRGADKDTLDKAGAIELLIVAAGARGDLGQHEAAVAMLQVRELTADEDAEWAGRLRYAYADALLAAGRRDEAREWFGRAAAADEDHLTDAEERLLELDGVTIEGDDEEDDDEQDSDERAAAGDRNGQSASGDRDESAGDDLADEDEDDDLDDDDEDDETADDDLDDEDDDDDVDDQVDGLAADEDDEDDEDESAGSTATPVAPAVFLDAAPVDDEIDAGIDGPPETDPRVDSEDEKALGDEFVAGKSGSEPETEDDEDLAVEGGTEGKSKS